MNFQQIFFPLAGPFREIVTLHYRYRFTKRDKTNAVKIEATHNTYMHRYRHKSTHPQTHTHTHTHTHIHTHTYTLGNTEI